MPSVNETATFLLEDLDRWAFGPLLAKRAAWNLDDAVAIDALVRHFRLGILLAVLESLGPDFAPLSAEVRALRPLAADDQAPYALRHSQWETHLAERFLDALEALAPMGESEAPLTRFAHGQYFKYSRRVAYLLKMPPVLPCFYAPASKAQP